MKGNTMKAKPKKTAARKPAKKKPPQNVTMIPVDPIPREPRIVTTKKHCPRCGEEVAIKIERSYFGGKKYYRCYSEQCKNSGARKGAGRGFVVMP